MKINALFELNTKEMRLFLKINYLNEIYFMKHVETL